LLTASISTADTSNTIILKSSPKEPIRIGCTGLLTDLPLFVAKSKGFFAAEGVSIRISLELGWKSIESKLSAGSLSVANVPTIFPLVLSLKRSGIALPMEAVAITSCHGETITLNHATMAAFLSGKLNSLKSVRIGVDALCSGSDLFVQKWLKGLRLQNTTAIQLVPIAISQLIDLLKEGYIHGFCCAEPASQIALQMGFGSTVARSRDHSPLEIQSVLAATDTFCAANPSAVKAIALALGQARSFCANSKNEAEIMHIYREQKIIDQVFSGGSLEGKDLTAPLSSLISFEPVVTEGALIRESLNSLVAVCAALPDASFTEREIRDEIKRVFHALI
jgi:ABC-type nitrate/sulfonate/bicarbonate transport system substrate-binding protein